MQDPQCGIFCQGCRKEETALLPRIDELAAVVFTSISLCSVVCGYRVLLSTLRCQSCFACPSGASCRILTGSRNVSPCSFQKVLIFKNAPCIHSFFVFFRFDAIFLDDSFRVIAYKNNIPPFSILKPIFNSTYTLEVVNRCFDFKIGDKILIDEH